MLILTLRRRLVSFLLAFGFVLASAGVSAQQDCITLQDGTRICPRGGAHDAPETQQAGRINLEEFDSGELALGMSKEEAEGYLDGGVWKDFDYADVLKRYPGSYDVHGKWVQPRWSPHSFWREVIFDANGELFVIRFRTSCEQSERFDEWFSENVSSDSESERDSECTGYFPGGERGEQCWHVDRTEEGCKGVLAELARIEKFVDYPSCDGCPRSAGCDSSLAFIKK